ncbi:MAG TPA: DUF6502 family protein [Acidocella sp.]|nr:DUF6502 family protein [Acidocella sp.]HQU05475.1 DUF6502 family protein [Acidocella sp.]
MIRRLLQPLIRYLISKGWGYIALRDLLKECYVHEAVRANQVEGDPTDSLISLVTGIHRGEVKRLRALALEAENANNRLAKTGATLAARVVATWVSDPRFCDKNGQPIQLALRQADGVKEAVPWIDTLLQAARIDIRGRTVVDEMLRAKTAELVDEKFIRLVQSAHFGADPAETLYFLGANVGDHMNAAFHNIKGEQPRFIERALFHNSISAQQLDTIRPELSKMADHLLRQANQRLLEGQIAGTEAASGEKIEPRRRLRLGVYYYEADEGDAP